MKFRKKPVVIQAWHNDGIATLPYWIIKEVRCGKVSVSFDGKISIVTLEGTMRAEIGDWIIQGVAGELYPCKPDIFDKTYEPADTAPTPPAQDDEALEVLRLALDALTCDHTGDDISDSHRCGRCDENVDRNASVRQRIRALLEKRGAV